MYLKSLNEKLDEYSLPEPMSGCWLWVGSLRAGYGRVALQRGRKVTQYSAHRAMFERFRGPIPPGLELDHRCRTRCCVNPDHLDVVTTAENIRRGLAYRSYARKACPRGHAYEGTNDRGRGTRGKRRCAVCYLAMRARDAARGRRS